MYPFVEGAYQYADLAMQWAAKYGMGVWLGVHAVNGSQNGYEASAPEIARKEIWDDTSKANPTYQNQSLAFVTQLCQRYGSSPALVAVSLMNEPTVRGWLAPPVAALSPFLTCAFATMPSASVANTGVAITQLLPGESFRPQHRIGGSCPAATHSEHQPIVLARTRAVAVSQAGHPATNTT